jgi:hypothetical protein
MFNDARERGGTSGVGHAVNYERCIGFTQAEAIAIFRFALEPHSSSVTNRAVHSAEVADPNVDLWAIDEVHFQQHGSRCQMWIPPETMNPILFHHLTRRSVGYFGAVRLRDGKFFFHRETDKVQRRHLLCFSQRPPPCQHRWANKGGGYH